MARDAEPRMSHAARGSEMDNPSSELAPCEGPDLRPICIASAGDGIDLRIASVAPALTRYPASAASNVSSGPGLNLPSLLLTSCPRIPLDPPPLHVKEVIADTDQGYRRTVRRPPSVLVAPQRTNSSPFIGRPIRKTNSLGQKTSFDERTASSVWHGPILQGADSCAERVNYSQNAYRSLWLD